MNPSASETKPASIFRLPRIGSPAYHILLGAVAIFVLGPLGGVSAAFMNFSIGFFIGGQVLAGILGSAVTLPYGPEGKHGANYIQTMSASVAGMCGLGVLIQAMVWLGLPQPPNRRDADLRQDFRAPAHASGRVKTSASSRPV